MENGRVDNPVLKDYAEKSSINASSGSAATLDISTANVFKITLTANCILTITNPSFGSTFSTITVLLKQDSTGSRTVTWPSSVTWAGGSAPHLSTNPNFTDVFYLFTINNGALWFGELIARQFSS